MEGWGEGRQRVPGNRRAENTGQDLKILVITRVCVWGGGGPSTKSFTSLIPFKFPKLGTSCFHRPHLQMRLTEALACVSPAQSHTSGQ